MSAMQYGQKAAEVVLDGNTVAYATAIDALYKRYVAMRASVYAQERRWPDAPFWARRHRRPAVDAGEPTARAEA
jgi:hypothetical protein